MEHYYYRPKTRQQLFWRSVLRTASFAAAVILSLVYLAR